jgi:hypothetical protein
MAGIGTGQGWVASSEHLNTGQRGGIDVGGTIEDPTHHNTMKRLLHHVLRRSSHDKNRAGSTLLSALVQN